jgi:hypothetical protein
MIRRGNLTEAQQAPKWRRPPGLRIAPKAQLPFQ